MTRARRRSASTMAPEREPPPIDDRSGAYVALTEDGWSAEAAALFGYAEHEALGASYVELLVPPEQRANALASATAAGREGLRCRRGGERLWIALSAECEPGDGGPAQRTLVHRDVTEQRALADAARLRERWGALLEALPEALVAADPCGRIVLFNGAAEQLFGHARAQLLGRPVELLLPEVGRSAHGADGRALGAAHARPLAGGLVVRARRKGGEAFSAEVSFNPVDGGERGPLVLSAVRDVSERESARAALAEQSAQLSSARRARRKRASSPA